MFLCIKLTHLDFIVSLFLMCNSISLKMNKFFKIKVLRKALFAFASLTALVVSSSVFVSCHESLEKRAQREAREYTERNCPTPWDNNDVRTDSVGFDIDSRTYIYYCSVRGKADNADFINANRQVLTDNLKEDVNSNPNLKAFKEAAFSFAYILRSHKDAKQVLFSITITPKDYEKSLMAIKH